MDANQALGILGLGPDASADDIKDVYRDLTKVWHPDRFANDPGLRERAEEKFKIINEAYQVLQGHPFRPIIDSSSSPVAPAHQGPPQHTRMNPRDHRRSHARAPNKSGHRSAFLAYGLIGVVMMGSVEYAVWRHRVSEARNSPSTRQASPSPPEQQNEVDASLAKSDGAGESSTAGTPKPADSAGQGGTELKRGTRRESRAGAPKSISENDIRSSNRSHATARTEDSLSNDERASLKAACSQAKYLEGPAAFNQCIEDHLARLASAPSRPDLSSLSASERQSLEEACSKAKYMEGPASYNQCLQIQFARWTSSKPRPDLSGLSNSERESIEAVCSQSNYLEGPAAYNACLSDQLVRLAATPKHPDLSKLSASDRESIQAVCSQAKYLAGPAAYNACLIKQLALLTAGQSRE
jgi:curved DNA-binding protein CbpA